SGTRRRTVSRHLNRSPPCRPRTTRRSARTPRTGSPAGRDQLLSMYSRTAPPSGSASRTRPDRPRARHPTTTGRRSGCWTRYTRSARRRAGRSPPRSRSVSSATPYADALQDPLERQARPLGHQAYRRDRTLEQAQDDLVVDDEQRAEVLDRLPLLRKLRHVRGEPLVEVTQVVLAHPGPDTPRDVAGSRRAGHDRNGRFTAAARNQGLP